ncbi:MAG: hypothetical protein FWC29_02405, partial [Methanomassiliicoccaceae archaeon]|nr:hypothetical protein [Methanomassiliicoccaceae archaeon]
GKAVLTITGGSDGTTTVAIPTLTAVVVPGVLTTFTVNLNDPVTLTAVPDATYAFLGWYIDFSGTAPSLNVVMDANKATYSSFGIPYIPPVVIEYQITATSDGMATISPKGTIKVEGGSDKTFYFSAAEGYHVLSVVVDGTSLAAGQVDLGYYIFTDVRANHTIYVNSAIGPRTIITLNITVEEGRGYEEYSINGSSFVRYVSSVSVPEHASVVVRAYAGEGYDFVRWETPATQTSSTISFGDVKSSLDLHVYFNKEDNGTLWWIIALILLLVLIGLLIWFLFYRRRYDVIKVSSSASIIGKDRVRRKAKYIFTVEGGYAGTISYRIGEDGQWKILTSGPDGQYIIPKEDVVDTITIEVR